jgi:hypothetical protein
VGRNELRVTNLQRALAPMSGVPVWRTLRRQLAAGRVPSQEAYWWAERLESQAHQAPPPACWGVPDRDGGRRSADPTALAAWATPERPRPQGAGSRCWLTVMMTLCYGHGPFSVLGRGCGVHQTTLVRWVVGLALA